MLGDRVITARVKWVTLGKPDDCQTDTLDKTVFLQRLCGIM
jgi:hypothetical protein